MDRRTLGILLVCSLVVAAVVTVAATAVARGLDSKHCKAGYPTLLSCKW